MLIDLQLHSTYSDGYLTPAALAGFLASRGVKIAALTDHHSIAGLDEFKRSCAAKKIKAIAGLELYASWKGRKFSLLWYNFNENSPELHQLLLQSQIRRRRQAWLALVKLKKGGLSIDPDKLLEKFSHYIPLNRLADQINLNRKNHNLLAGERPNHSETIKRLFKNPALGIFNESRVYFEHVLKLRRRLGGQLILNHPARYNKLDEKFIADLKKAGLDGLEMISPHHSITAVMRAQLLVSRYKLIASGGSDFHLSQPGRMKLKNCYDYFRIDAKYLPGVEKIIG